MENTFDSILKSDFLSTDLEAHKFQIWLKLHLNMSRLYFCDICLECVDESLRVVHFHTIQNDNQNDQYLEENMERYLLIWNMHQWCQIYTASTTSFSGSPWFFFKFLMKIVLTFLINTKYWQDQFGCQCWKWKFPEWT